MLLNYLFENFYEEAAFIHHAGLDFDSLRSLLEQRVLPKPSYVLNNTASSKTFLGQHEEMGTYRFYLKRYTDWVVKVERFDLHNEKKALGYFEAEYTNARDLFFDGENGREILRVMPNLSNNFDNRHIDETWAHFLNGVYGICTRDGMPDSIFFKQVTVRLIDYLIDKHGTTGIPETLQPLLRRAVNFLDSVESDFAPHEVSTSSRQRCIIDLRAAL